MVARNGSKKDSLILECARLREVARTGIARGARLALENALAALATKLLKVLGLDLLPQRLARRLVRIHMRLVDGIGGSLLCDGGVPAASLVGASRADA